jgi:plastocyanin
MRRLMLLVLAAAAMALPIAAARADTKTVQIVKTGFVPNATTVNVGDTVTWRNADTVDHQVVANDGSFASATLKPGDTFSFTLTKPGKVQYHDALNTKLKGSVTATGPPAGVTLTTASQAVVYGSGTTLSGSVSSQLVSEPVVLSAQPYGEKTVKQVDAATTTTNGTFQFAVNPTIQTVYEAKWRTATSSPVTVLVRPRIGLGLSGRIYTAKATSDASYQGHYVLAQRHTAYGWTTMKRVFLGASSQAKFRLALPRGRSLVRVYMPATQAGAGYIAGWSRIVAVRR